MESTRDVHGKEEISDAEGMVDEETVEDEIANEAVGDGEGSEEGGDEGDVCNIFYYHQI